MTGRTGRSGNGQSGVKNCDKSGEKNEKKKDKQIKGQTTSTGKGGKTVSFEPSVEKKDAKEDNSEKALEEMRVLEEVRKIRQEKIELGKLKIELEGNLVEMTERLEIVEKRLYTLEAREKEREEQEAARSISQYSNSHRSASSMGAPADGATGPQWSLHSHYSGVSRTSAASRMSLTEREVWRMKRLVNEQDKKERENNVVIKGLRADVGKENEAVDELFIDKLDVKINIESVRTSGRILIVRLEKNEKAEIMKRKSRLAGTRIYIENDLSFEDRKRQVEMYRWIKEKRELGWNIRAGQGRVLFNGIWRRWEENEIEKMEMEFEKKKKEENIDKNEIEDTKQKESVLE